MPLNINIEDKDITGFNDNAKKELETCVKKFSEDIISEAYRIEASLNGTSKGPEITSTMVSDARVFIRHKITKPKRKTTNIIIKILANVFTLLAGILFDTTKLAESWYLVLYILIVVATVFLITLSIFKED